MNILIAGGERTYDTGLTDVEILSINSNETCGPVKDLPTGKFGASAAWHLERPTICGGYYSEECYRYLVDNDYWEPYGALPHHQDHAASVSWPNGDWWIAGGSAFVALYYYETYINITQEGIRVPVPTEQHCIARINETHAIMTGGVRHIATGLDETTKYHKQAYIIDWTTKSWSETTSMASHHAGHACFVFGDYAYVIGGWSQDDDVVPTEKYNLVTREWTVGPPLPGSKRLEFAATVEYDETYLLIGGREVETDEESDAVFQFDEKLQDWVERTERLQLARCAHSAIPFPDGTVDCSK